MNNRKEADPSEIEGKKRLRYMEFGYLTCFDKDRPLRMAGPESELQDKQTFRLEYNKDRRVWRIRSERDQNLGVHFHEPAMQNFPLVVNDRPCEFKICNSEKGAGWYTIHPVLEEKPPQGTVFEMGMAQMLVFPPIVALMPEYIERFSWKFENA